MTSNLHPRDTSLHLREELKNPMDNASNAFGVLFGAITVGLFFYYCTRNIMKPQVSISLSLICFGLMLILEVVLLMARFYLSDHPDPSLKKEKSSWNWFEVTNNGMGRERLPCCYCAVIEWPLECLIFNPVWTAGSDLYFLNSAKSSFQKAINSHLWEIVLTFIDSIFYKNNDNNDNNENLLKNQ